MATMEEEKLDLIRYMNEMKSGSIEQMILTIRYCLEAYFRSLIVFGSDNKVTRENIEIIKEMFKILNTERSFLDYIRQNIDHFDIEASQDVVFLLDSINDETVEYYYGLMNDIDDAIDLVQEFRGYRPRIPFPSLLNDPSYAIKVIALGENLDSIQEFLGFEEDFWQYINERTEFEDEINTPGVYPISNSTNDPIDLKIVLPKVTNLDSALQVIKLYRKAYEMYQILNKPFNKELETDTDLEEKYQNVYLINKARKTLGLKNVK